MQGFVVTKELMVVNILGWFCLCPDYYLQNFSTLLIKLMINKFLENLLSPYTCNHMYMDSISSPVQGCAFISCSLQDHNFVQEDISKVIYVWSVEDHQQP